MPQNKISNFHCLYNYIFHNQLKTKSQNHMDFKPKEKEKKIFLNLEDMIRGTTIANLNFIRLVDL